MDHSLYPLKFHPIFKDKIWGGEKIKKVLNKNFSPLPNCGESWEISCIEGDVSEVANGFLAGNDLNELVEIYMYDLLGEDNYHQFGLGFPLLIKFIDSARDLSVQVHPDDQLAMERYGESGKSELWYILDAEPGSGLYIGFKKGVTREKYKDAVEKKNVDHLLNFYPVKKGDAFFIPAGTIHAIGKGILLTEIQQTSDITYRVFDWNRIDHNGQSRELHVEEALDAIHFDDTISYHIAYEEKNNSTVKLIRDSHFSVNFLAFDKPLQKNYINIDSFVIYICTEGEVHFLQEKEITIIKKGEVLLKPASIEELNLVPVGHSKLLEIYIELPRKEE